MAHTYGPEHAHAQQQQQQQQLVHWTLSQSIDV